MHETSEIIRLLRHIRLFCGIIAGVSVMAISVTFFPEIVLWTRGVIIYSIYNTGPAVAIAAVVLGFIAAIVLVAMTIGRSATPPAAEGK